MSTNAGAVSGAAGPPARRARSKRRRRIFIALSLLFPILLVLVIELVLRACGFGGYPQTFRKVGQLADGSSLIITDNPGPASYFFANRSRPGTLSQSAFVMPKPKDTFRIVLAGESAMKGFPQPRSLSSGAFLEAMLEDAWPGRDVEVINLGTTAVASFPVLGMLTESLDYDPDLVVVYVGNNEFFGAYGVASLHTAGRSPTAIRLIRGFRWLAVAQALDSVLSGSDATADKTLMEAMVGKSSIGPDDPIRAAAAHNLLTFTSQMVARCRQRGVPILVCTLPANERDLAPLGAGPAKPGDADDPAALVAKEPSNAGAVYRLGLAQSIAGDDAKAAASFQTAIDLDPMPWRPTSSSVAALRAAAQEQGGILCDLQGAFRAASQGGAVGWDLMDDHVHPSLKGQDLVARTIVATLAEQDGPGAVSEEEFARLAPWEEYAARLGENEFDRFGVAHTMRVLGRIPFFRDTNPQFVERFDAICRDIESRMSPAVKAAAIEWQKPETHRGGEQRPITAMVGRVLIQGREFERAESLYAAAARSVSQYSSWNLEYTYFKLVCRERVRGALNEDDRAAALEAIRRGEFLLGQGRSTSGQAERFVGRLHQLRREYDKAIPFLLTAREKLSGTDLVANDQALVESYLQTGQLEKARKTVQNGIEHSGEYAELYRRMEAGLPK